jgi:hypothetical protein
MALAAGPDERRLHIKSIISKRKVLHFSGGEICGVLALPGLFNQSGSETVCKK